MRKRDDLIRAPIMEYGDIQEKLSTAIQAAEADGYMETAIALRYLKADLTEERRKNPYSCHDNVVMLGSAQTAGETCY